MIKKETFSTDGDYFPVPYAYNMVMRTRNPSNAFKDAKDIILAFGNSRRNDTGFCNQVKIQVETIINNIRNNYERTWLQHLFNAHYVNKNLDSLEYYVGNKLQD